MPGVNAMPGKTILLGTQAVSRQTLLEHGARAATALDRIDVREGDAIALLIRNDPCISKSSRPLRIWAPMWCRSTGTARLMRSATSCRIVRRGS